MINRILASVIITLSISSCSNNQESNNDTRPTNNSYHIELENNKKWEVNKEMIIHVKNMKKDIQSTSSQPNPNFRDLGEKLAEHISLLTSNCTMTGKAHNELHKWLLPFIDLVDQLNKASTIEEQKASFDAIKEAMNQFNNYFK